MQVGGQDLNANYAFATQVAARIQQVAGLADVHIQQIMGQPTLLLSSNRSFASGTGLTESDIAGNALAVLSGSGQVAPTYWLDTSNGISHLVDVQTPQSQLATVNDLQTITVDKGDGNPGRRRGAARGRPVAGVAGRHARPGVALRDQAGDRHLRERRGPRPRRGQRRHPGESSPRCSRRRRRAPPSRSPGSPRP